MTPSPDCPLPTADCRLPLVLVAGLGRCGTSLALAMLAAGGVPVLGEAPGFEPPEADFGAEARLPAGVAVKFLDPHRRPAPTVRPRLAIWLDRNPVEQAKSQIRFVRLAGLRAEDNRSARAKWVAMLVRDRSRSVAALKSAGTPLRIFLFESLIQAPEVSAAALAAYLAPWWRLDTAAMAAVVRRRGPAAEPDDRAAAHLLGGFS